jgi:Cytochrome C''.
MTILAQKRPYDVVMKDVNTTFGNLRKNLDGAAMPSAAEDAAKLQSLFKETEEFWKAFKTKDAIEASKSAAVASESLAAAAREGNGQKAQAAYGAIGKYCKACHDSHRELMPDKSYRIKP